ncbi:class I SAM-dependent methyltransferase [Capillimicrobium parvum]|uniref:Methyltransferase domain-containing protein n=1 Tax=Capillimicrobium parvum TaxID=2884022 RepID=A0A9E6Y3T3_9ACTN|nr:class I SAM-dependent methyltransferase [Capillimicrobium parvum]UGS38827.1 hypothetical protein DSM104329_05257 [Capillimicrobium parvum]
MNSNPPPGDPADLDPVERKRLERAYGGYAADPARQQAWDAANPGNVALRAEVGARLERVAGPALAGDRPILDAGCGAGYWLGWLQDRGVAPARLRGAEMIAARADAARRRVPGADVRQADVRRLPFENASCALVLLFTVLSSQVAEADRAATVREARRVAGPAGLVVVWDLRRTARAVPAAFLRRELGPGLRTQTSTLVPPVARRLGPATERVYPLLVRLPPLRTHWFAWAPGA